MYGKMIVSLLYDHCVAIRKHYNQSCSFEVDKKNKMGMENIDDIQIKPKSSYLPFRKTFKVVAQT